MLNITSTMSPNEILMNAHNYTAVPAIWISYIFFSLVFLITGLLLINKSKSGYQKFLLIWFVAIFIGGVFNIFLTLSPNTIQVAVEFIQLIFKV